MDLVICNSCGKKFKRKKSQIKLAVKHYCSISCSEQGRRKGRDVLCSTCGIEVYRPLKQINGSKSGKYFCTKKCLLRWIHKKHDGHPNWKGGKHVYRNILIKSDPNKIFCLLCKESNLLMLVVHHLDKNRLNNNINNLVWLCHNCHFLIHNYLVESKKLSSILYAKKV